MVSTLKFEFFIIFFFIPIFISFNNSSILVFIFLYLVFFYSLNFLRKDNFDFSKLKKKVNFNFVLLWTIIFLISGFIYTLILDKNLLFKFPANNFEKWLLVVVLYPLFSVLPQEVIFRVFFLRRYKNFLKEKKLLKYLINSIVFSFGHIVFNNFHAVLITFLVSAVFTYAFAKKSFSTLISIQEKISFAKELGVIIISSNRIILRL